MWETVGLSLAYVCGAGALSVAALGCGLLFNPRIEWRGPADWFWEWLLRYALGLVILSSMMIGLGLLGWISRTGVAAVVCGPAAVGWWRFWKEGGNRGSLGAVARRLDEEWRLLPAVEKGLCAVVGVWIVIFSIHHVIGGLSPDMGDDAVWYHLTVPGQWVLTGKASAFPYLMSSNHPLAMEALYAALLSFGDEILCSSLYAQATLALFFGALVYTARVVGARKAAWFAATGWVFYGIIKVTVTGGAANDNLAALLMFVGLTLLLDPLREGEPPLSKGRAALAGILVGGSSAAKMVTTGYWPVAAAVVFFLLWRRGMDRRALGIRLGLFAAGAAAVYSPWALRAWMGCGNPLFPFGVRWIPMRPGWEEVARGAATVWPLYPLTLDGLLEAFGTGLRFKARLAMTSLDVMAGIVAITLAGSLFRRDPYRRAIAWTLLFCLSLTLWIDCKNEVLRFYGVAYPLALPAFALLLGEILSPLGNRTRALMLILMMAGGMFTHVKHVAQWTNMRTMQWEFRPVVTRTQRDRRARIAEHGDSYRGGEQVRERLPADAILFAPDINFPYYLKRVMVWSENMELIDRFWAGKDADGVRQFLLDGGFTHLFLRNRYDDPRVVELSARGDLIPIPLTEEPSSRWRLFRVSVPPGAK